MNLVEQFGGYEVVKQATSNYKQSGDMVTAAGLELRCLEYRRKQKIYEVGDLVVCEHFEMDEVKHLLTVEIVRGHYLQLSDGVSCTAHLVRHATDGEIKAGRRL